MSSQRSKVEIKGFEAKFYDIIMKILTFGEYEKWIETAVNEAEIKNNTKILEFGCGTGIAARKVLKNLEENGLYIGIDISEIMLKKAYKKCKNSKNIFFIKKRIEEKLDFFKNKFDAVFMSFVMHGFENEDKIKIIKNAYNNLKSKGKFIILDYSQNNFQNLKLWQKIFISKIECPLAKEFIEMNFPEFVEKFGFKFLKEKYIFKNFLSVYIFEKE